MSAGRSEQIGKGCSEDRGEIGSEIGEGFREFCTLMFATHVVVVEVNTFTSSILIWGTAFQMPAIPANDVHQVCDGL